MDFGTVDFDIIVIEKRGGKKMSTIGKISIAPEMAQSFVVADNNFLYISELEALRRALAENSTDENLAEIFAKTSNQTGKLFHMVDDPENSVEENEKYLEESNLWWDFYIELLEEIKARLIKSNEEIGTSYVTENAPFREIATNFMEKQGYRDGGSWWIKQED